MSVPNKAQLSIALQRAHRSAPSVERFVSLLVQSMTDQQEQLDAPPTLPATLNVSQINFGNNARLRALPNGLVIELLGRDKIWHPSVQYLQILQTTS